MKNLVKLLIVILMAVIYQIVHKQIEDNKINVEINENVEYLIYDNKKKSINDIDFDDIKNVDISKNKFYRILDYKKLMGSIQKVDDLIVLERFTEEDIEKLKMVFEDNKEKVQYNSCNINTATKKHLKFIGLSNKSIEKVKEYREKKKIENLIELQSIIKEDISTLKASIYF